MNLFTKILAVSLLAAVSAAHATESGGLLIST
jgi:hypothetical protein